jgi:hypothetical protein
MWICVCVCEIGIFKERYECVCVRESVCERVWVHVRKLVIRECGRVGVACISPSRHAHTHALTHIHLHLHTYTYTYTHTLTRTHTHDSLILCRSRRSELKHLLGALSRVKMRYDVRACVCMCSVCVVCV